MFNNVRGESFGGFLGEIIAVKKVHAMFEGGSGDVMKKTGKGLFSVVGEMPDDESDSNGMIETGIEELAVVHF